jgi:hypothetical protein
VYSNAITTEKRELFNAEIKYRVEALSEAIGLEPGFISGVYLLSSGCSGKSITLRNCSIKLTI